MPSVCVVTVTGAVVSSSLADGDPNIVLREGSSHYVFGGELGLGLEWGWVERQKKENCVVVVGRSNRVASVSVCC